MFSSFSSRYTLFICCTAIFCSGCCSYSNKQKHYKDSPVLKVEIDDVNSKKESEKKTPIRQINDQITDPSDSTRKKNKQAQDAYSKFERSFEMYHRGDYESALRELGRVQTNIDDDPNLEMQTWYLSAMIYDKTGKDSRRKRAMRKMLETMEILQKDPRFRTAFEHGKLNKEIIGIAMKEERHDNQ